LFEHLRQSSIQTQIQLSVTGHYLASRLGHDTHGAALRLLQVTGTKQATTLSDADAFLFMTLVGLVALSFVPLISPAAGLPGKPAKNPPPAPAGQPTLAGQTT
jgi:DHA2 family multidrug resistance protein